ncbi:MAG TPA: hypothetical protein VN861_01065 [Candidatus Acidoferrales bacterium]|nr:hypothetical protein [Candidatus Acidoferrales bacterium]
MTTDTTHHADQAESPSSKSFTRYLPAAGRFLMGLSFFVFGLNGFLNFIPQPKTPMPQAAAAFAAAMMNTGYMMQLVSGTQLIVGVLLLTNRFVPLALALIAPVIVNIIMFHAVLAPSGIVPGGVVLALELYLAWVYRKAFSPMLSMRATPHGR